MEINDEDVWIEGREIERGEGERKEVRKERWKEKKGRYKSDGREGKEREEYIS